MRLRRWGLDSECLSLNRLALAVLRWAGCLISVTRDASVSSYVKGELKRKLLSYRISGYSMYPIVGPILGILVIRKVNTTKQLG